MHLIQTFYNCTASRSKISAAPCWADCSCDCTTVTTLMCTKCSVFVSFQNRQYYYLPAGEMEHSSSCLHVALRTLIKIPLHVVYRVKAWKSVMAGGLCTIFFIFFASIKFFFFFTFFSSGWLVQRWEHSLPSFLTHQPPSLKTWRCTFTLTLILSY